MPARETYVEAAEPVYKAKTASGQDYYSDSKILLVDLRPAANGEARLHPATPASAPPATNSLSATLR